MVRKRTRTDTQALSSTPRFQVPPPAPAPVPTAPSPAPTPPSAAPDQPDPWAACPITTAWSARDALRRCLIELRRVRPPLDFIQLDGEGRIQTDEAFEPWLAAHDRLQVVRNKVFRKHSQEQFRHLREPQLLNALLAIGVSAPEAEHVSSQTVSDLLRYFQAGYFKLRSDCLRIRYEPLWVADTATLAVTDSLLTAEHMHRELAAHAGQGFPNPFHVHIEWEHPRWSPPPHRTSNDPAAVGDAIEHAANSLWWARLFAREIVAESDGSLAGWSTATRIADLLREARRWQWASVDVFQSLRVSRSIVFQVPGTEIFGPSVHDAVVNLGGEVLRVLEDAGKATVASASVERDRLSQGTYHPCEVNAVARWITANHPALLAAVSESGFQRLKAELDVEAAHLRKELGQPQRPADTRPVPNGIADEPRIVNGAATGSETPPATGWRVVVGGVAYRLRQADGRLFTAVGELEQEIETQDRQAWRIAFAMGSPVQGKGMSADALIKAVKADTGNPLEWANDIARKIRRFLERSRFAGVGARYEDGHVYWEVSH